MRRGTTVIDDRLFNIQLNQPIKIVRQNQMVKTKKEQPQFESSFLGNIEEDMLSNDSSEDFSCKIQQQKKKSSLGLSDD